MKLHYHPLSSYCWKVLIALYEMKLDFEGHILNLGDEAVRASFSQISPMGKMPALEVDGKTLTESSIIIEYLDQRHHAGLMPTDRDKALQTRMIDRFYDLYVMNNMQKVVTDKLRPAGQGDPFGVDQARASLLTAYSHLERELAGHPWALDDHFSLADCSAAPALYYADKVVPLGDFSNLAGYLSRLKHRPSFHRVLEEAKPYFHLFPRDH